MRADDGGKLGGRELLVGTTAAGLAGASQAIAVFQAADGTLASAAPVRTALLHGAVGQLHRISRDAGA